MVADSYVKAIDGSQGAVAVHGRLAVQAETVVEVAVVGTDIQEVVTLCIMAAVERGGIRPQFAVEMGVDGRSSCMEGAVAVKDTGAGIGSVGIVLLVHLRLCPVVAVGKQGGCRSVVVEGGILRTVGGKGRQPAVRRQADGSR